MHLSLLTYYQSNKYWLSWKLNSSIFRHYPTRKRRRSDLCKLKLTRHFDSSLRLQLDSSQANTMPCSENNPHGFLLLISDTTKYKDFRFMRIFSARDKIGVIFIKHTPPPLPANYVFVFVFLRFPFAQEKL